MEWLNYHHLLYFWMVAREGGVSKAAEKLRLSQPTVSAQVRRLERALGERLFERQGRTAGADRSRGASSTATPTRSSRSGRELRETLRGPPFRRPPSSRSASPTPCRSWWSTACSSRRSPAPHRCGSPASRTGPINWWRGSPLHELDVVLSDAPAAPHVRAKVYDHLLGESGTSFFAAAPLARRLRPRFPASLASAPILLPTADSALRRRLEEWFEARRAPPARGRRVPGPGVARSLRRGRRRGLPGAHRASSDEVCRHYRGPSGGPRPPRCASGTTRSRSSAGSSTRRWWRSPPARAATSSPRRGRHKVRYLEPPRRPRYGPISSTKGVKP